MSNNTQDPPVTVDAGNIRFVEACHPPRVAGPYSVGMSQNIGDPGGEKPWHEQAYKSELQFVVDAPRFSLNPADIHSVYPPANGTGRFDNALPHVVFTRRTLPWERTLDGNEPELGEAFPPWLCLLLLEEDELLIPGGGGRSRDAVTLPICRNGPEEKGQEKGKQDSLLEPLEPERIIVPQLKGDLARHRAESCLVLDLPADLFRAIAPSSADLPYLAHVRQIDTGNKEVFAVNDRGWFSLVMGNRLPQAGKRHRVFLVSLEGHQERLTEKDWQPAGGQLVRLAILGTWAFACEGANDFKAHMEGLDVDSLHLPYVPYDNAFPDARDIVSGAYSRGYTAFDHAMRQGEKTVSWYRGPLVPLGYGEPGQTQKLVSCADELLRYDPRTGLLDVTYAAAWQLGRLLALQNQSFALALNRARQAIRAKAEEVIRQAELREGHKELGLPEGECSEDRLLGHIANGGGDRLKNAVPE